jgi:hypothetical protein
VADQAGAGPALTWHSPQLATKISYTDDQPTLQSGWLPHGPLPRLQTPDTFLRLAQVVKDRFARRSGGVRLTVKGDLGVLITEITEDTDVAALAKLIKDGLVGKLNSER